MTDTTPTWITGVRTIAIPVTDQDASIEFYSTTLGFETTVDGFIDELGTRWVQMSSADASIALIPGYPSFEAGRDTGVRLTTPDAAALHAHLTDNGVKVSELLLWEGLPPMFEFSDPDGNVLYVME
ncbi:VOC family protein [Rhodococcoides kyotonense]|uniref:Catechol 2,3-dioxygenase n=1 Tax=Rhodococcoides kyotonense TaxID=398843 RepID=A0A239KK45_9NOCA|nr:VOC family protein [Rhodococcus kyotonensis]SNT17544.1 Catechol 2,3-dioxygenase [Rhodococcus kyotonensis]